MDKFFYDIKKRAAKQLDHGDKLYLYGSRARGDNKPNSDWDLLIITNKTYDNNQAFNKYIYPIIHFGQENQQEISVLTYSIVEWESLKASPFYMNVIKDRITII